MKAVSGRGAGCRFFVIEAPKKVTKEDSSLMFVLVEPYGYLKILSING